MDVLAILEDEIVNVVLLFVVAVILLKLLIEFITRERISLLHFFRRVKPITAQERQFIAKFLIPFQDNKEECF